MQHVSFYLIIISNFFFKLVVFWLRAGKTEGSQNPALDAKS